MKGMIMGMSMSRDSVIPWLDQPVVLHSSRADKCSLTEAQCRYRAGYWRYWYQADYVYALSTVYLLCAIIGVFAISNFLVRFASGRVKGCAAWRRTASISRSLAYRGYRFPALQYWSPSIGVMALGAAGATFFFAMTLVPKPYYWPKDANYGGSPPIATRAGWMALGLLPFVLALSSKANMISALTGIAHEKLQIFHHWTSYAMFALALVHTFPFIVYNISKGDMVQEWKTSVVYWTGAIAIIAQAYLTFMSLPGIRNRFYEFFKATHFFAAVIFVVFFFLHCDFRLSSWDYFIAAGSIYTLSLLTAHIRTYLMHGLHTSTLKPFPCGLVRIVVPTIITWTPGQHVFIRFLTSDLHLLTAHPFTISSACRDPERAGKPSELVFYIKPRRGVTARLAALATQRPGRNMKILLDGPYGGVSATHLSRFDSILVVAGGSGGGFSLAMVDEALQLSAEPIYQKGDYDEEEGKSRRHRSLHVVYTTRDPRIADWYIEEIETRLSLSTTMGHGTDSDPMFETRVSVHVTSSSTPSSSHRDSGVSLSPPSWKPYASSHEKQNTKTPWTGITATDSFSLNVLRNARPQVSEIVGRAVFTAGAQPLQDRKQRLGVLVCGPASMLHDTRNAAASAQRRVLEGEVEEVYLHSEPFAW